MALNTKLAGSGCVEIAARITQEDQDALLKRLEDLEAAGTGRKEAQVIAAQDALQALLDERKEFQRLLREQHPDLFADDLDAMFDDVLAEEVGKDKAAGKKPLRSVRQSLGSAAKNTGSGLTNAIDGLGALFGGKSPGRLGSGPTFDEETYAKAKPLFLQAIKNFKDAAQDLREAMRAIVRMVLDKFGAQAAENMKPYVVRFMKDVQDGTVNLEGPATAAEGERVTLARGFLEDFEAGKSFGTIVAARARAAEIIGRKIEPGTADAKLVDEAVELAGVMFARGVVRAGGTAVEIYNRLQEFQENQMPGLNVRDTISLRNQAYSTPLPLAYVASKLAGVNFQKTVLEPTAGNGALVMRAMPSKTTTNEINPDRGEALRAQGYTPTQEDAATMKFAPKSVDIVIANPPFGPRSDERWQIDGLDTREIDHAISLNSLQAMKDDGTAVLIIGGPVARDDGARRDTYRGKGKREFFYTLYNSYNVVDHFTVAGDLYAKQGATFPVDVIVIKGRSKSNRALPAAQLPQLVDTWDALREKLNANADDLGAEGTGTPGGDTRGQGPGTQPGSVPGTPAPPTGADGGDGGTGGRPADGGSAAGGGTTGTAAGPQQDRPGSGRGQRGSPDGTAQPGDTGTDATVPGDQQLSSGADGARNQPAGVDARAGERKDRARVSEDDAGKLQVKYNNFSTNKPVNSLVATNHLTAIERAFEALRARVGDIDEFVRNELKYTPEQFKKSFSAEQVEALALAIDNIKRGAGFIIGDQTGMGKGRVVAAMIRYARLNGKMPVFVTQMPDLYGDMMRDLNDIGMGDIKPLMTNNNASVPLDAEALAWFGEKQGIQTQIAELQDDMDALAIADLGNKLNGLEDADRKKAIAAEVKRSTNLDIVAIKQQIIELRAEMPERRGKFLETPEIERHESMLRSMVEANSIGNFDVIFTTYNQMAPLDSGKPRRDPVTGLKVRNPAKFGYRNAFLQHFVNSNSMLILDEAHNAGEAGDGRFPKLGDVVRQLINASGGVFYSSATFAKNPRVMDAYSKTDLGKAFGNVTTLIENISSVPMQQTSSAMLVAAGQYLRRERSFDGIEYRIDSVEVNTQDAEDVSEAMRLIVDFDRAKRAAIQEIQDALDAEGAVMSAGGAGMSQASVDSVNFTSVMHNVINTFLLALKAEQAANKAIEAIRKGEKPVITVANTMGAFIAEYASAENLGIGDKIEATFADILTRYLEKTRTVTINHGNGAQSKVRLTDEQLGDDGVEAYNAARDFIEELELSVPLSPIDHIKQLIQAAGHSIGEITGRQTVVISEDIAPKPAIPETKFTFETLEDDEGPAERQRMYGKYATAKPYDLPTFEVGSVFQEMGFNGVKTTKAVVVGRVKESGDGNTFFVAKDLATGKLFIGIPPASRPTGEKLTLDRDYQSELDAYRPAQKARSGGVGGVLRKRPSAEMNTAGKKNTIAKFNGGQLDALIINRSGSTGLSMHASETFADQRRRVMVIAQAELDINNHMQMLGRINRTGQVSANGKAPPDFTATFGLPRYVQMTANVPIELRPAAVLSNKMAGLSANTTAGRKSAVEDKSAPDFMNKYGDRVAAELVGSDTALNLRLGLPVSFDENGRPAVEGAMAKVTGRIGLLPLKDQNELYDQLGAAYTELIAQLDALGQNELEAKTYPLDAKTLATREVIPADDGSDSPFTAAVNAERVNVKKLGKPWPKAKVEELVRAALGITDGNQTAANVARLRRAEMLSQMRRDIAAEQQANTEAAGTDPDKVTEATRKNDALDRALTRFQSMLPAIGQGVKLETDSGNLYGIVTNVERKGKVKSAGSLSAWKIRVAVVDGAKSMTFSMTQLAATPEERALRMDGVMIAPATEMTVISQDGTGTERVPIADGFDRGQTDARETRWMITGNVLRGYSQFKGRILNYTDSNGNILQGIMMPANFDLDAALRRVRSEMSDPAKIAALLDAGGVVVDKETGGDVVTLKRSGGAYIIEVRRSGTGKKISKDLGPYFSSVGNRMRAEIWKNGESDKFLAAVRDIINVFKTPLIADKDSESILREQRRPNPQDIARTPTKITHAYLKKNGRQVISQMDAERAFADGQRVFLLHESGGPPYEAQSVEDLAGYTPDQMLVVDQQRPNPRDIPRATLSYEAALKAAGTSEAGVKAWRAVNKASQRAPRVPAVQQAAQDLFDGKITPAQYREIVAKEQPIRLTTSVPQIPSMTEIVSALKQQQIETGIVGLNKQIPAGTPTALRLDIPAYDFYNTWVVSIHDGSRTGGNAIAYGQTGQIKNVDFRSSPRVTLNIARGAESKSTIARMHGEWVPHDSPALAKRAAELLNDPNWTQIGINPFRHSFFYDKTDGMPVVSAEEVIQIGPLVLARGVKKTTPEDVRFQVAGTNITFEIAPFPSPSYTFAETQDTVRVDALDKLKALEKKREAGKITEAEYRLGIQQLIDRMQQRNDERTYRRVVNGRKRGADWIIAKMRTGVSQGTVTKEATDFAQWLLDQNPSLGDGLGISVKSGSDAAGEYDHLTKVFTLVVGKMSDGTAVHEILHHSERMMPMEVQDGVLREWKRAWAAAYKDGSPELKRALVDMLKASLGDTSAHNRIKQAFRDGVWDYNNHYQLFSPSEFWAVNATRILAGRYGAKNSIFVKKAIQWFKEFVQRLRAAFGLRSDWPVIEGLNAVLEGNGTFLSPKMLMESNAPIEVMAQVEEKAPTGPRPPTVNDISRKVTDGLIKHFGRSNVKFQTYGAYHKTLSTQFNKALKDRDFGRVFAYANAMQNQVSLSSLRPAELAPRLLPRVDNIVSAARTLVKGKADDADTQGAADALFAGTLDGNSVLEGRIWEKEELINRFGLTERGVGLYNEARAAIDASLDEVSAAEAYSMVQGFVPKDVRRQIIDKPQSAETIITAHMRRMFAQLEAAIKKAQDLGADDRMADLEATRDSYLQIQRKVESVFNLGRGLKNAGYAPLMRFGKFTVQAELVNPETGQLIRGDDGSAATLYFERFETEAEAREALRRAQMLHEDNPEVRVRFGTASELQNEMYAGISPETLALFAEAVGATNVLRTYYQDAISERSALKRRLNRKGVPGYSKDMPRVLSNFITSNGRYAAQRFYLRDLTNAVKFVPQEKGDVKDEAIKLKNFVMNPNDPAAPVSSLMFAWFLGGSVAAMIVNLSQPYMVTTPYLTKFGSVAQVGLAVGKAHPYAMGRKEITDETLKRALKRASQEGIVDAQEIFHLYSIGAQSVAAKLVSALSRIPGAGGSIKAGSESARARINAFLTLWGSMFSMAERFNRKLTFIAAYNLATETGVSDPYAFAVRAVNETQGIYNKVNRPNWARGSVGRVLLTFKQYPIMIVELTNRMWRYGGPEGKRAALIMLGVLMLMSGEEGLPFAQDLDDIIDTIGQQIFGRDTNMKRWKREMAYEFLGKALGDQFLYGLSVHLPLDFSGRFSLGNLIPGTAMFKKSNAEATSREIAEAVGPVGGLLTQAMDAFEAWSADNYGKAAENLSPKAVKDVVAAAKMAKDGYAVDRAGRKVVDTTLGDAAIKAVGFNPTVVADVTRKTMPIQQDIALQRNVEASIVDQWVRGIVQDDEAMIQAAQKRRDDWNAKNPRTPIVIGPQQIKSRVKARNQEKETRVIKNAPPEMRRGIASELSGK